MAPAERTAILDALHTRRFAGLAPDEAWATLLDEGTYLGSVSTYYRVLREAGESHERPGSPGHVKPEHAADPARPWPSVKQPTVRTDRYNCARRPS